MTIETESAFHWLMSRRNASTIYINLLFLLFFFPSFYLHVILPLSSQSLLSLFFCLFLSLCLTTCFDFDLLIFLFSPISVCLSASPPPTNLPLPPTSPFSLYHPPLSPPFLLFFLSISLSLSLSVSLCLLLSLYVYLCF